MDRIELVERLDERLKETQAKKDELQVQVNKAYERTWEFIDNKFSITTKPEEWVMTCNGVTPSQLYVHSAYVEEDKYSLDKVIELGYRIKTCENDIKSLEDKLQEYKSKDFVGHIKNVMDD